jgi:hypothetical protein
MTRNLLFLLLIAGSLHAQQVQNFSLTNVLNGQAVSLETYPSCSGLAIIFTSNSCAFDEYYRNRIAQLAKDYHDKVPVLLVNSYTEPNESAEQMIKKAQAFGLTTPYLADKDQKLMQQLGATRSPQAYLLKNNGGKFTVIYQGALDDNPQVEGDVKHRYLKDAIDIMLTNQRVATPEVRPVGCTIRKK